MAFAIDDYVQVRENRGFLVWPNIQNSVPLTIPDKSGRNEQPC